MTSMKNLNQYIEEGLGQRIKDAAGKVWTKMQAAALKNFLCSSSTSANNLTPLGFSDIRIEGNQVYINGDFAINKKTYDELEGTFYNFRFKYIRNLYLYTSYSSMPEWLKGVEVDNLAFCAPFDMYYEGWEISVNNSISVFPNNSNGIPALEKCRLNILKDDVLFRIEDDDFGKPRKSDYSLDIMLDGLSITGKKIWGMELPQLYAGPDLRNHARYVGDMEIKGSLPSQAEKNKAKTLVKNWLKTMKWKNLIKNSVKELATYVNVYKDGKWQDSILVELTPQEIR